MHTEKTGRQESIRNFSYDKFTKTTCNAISVIVKVILYKQNKYYVFHKILDEKLYS